MKVKDVMTAAPEACRPDDNLAKAVERLWAADCGVLPVIDHTGRVAGILTDRDICIALGTRNAPASEVRVDSVMRTTVHTCAPDEDVLLALSRMTDHRVRRLPVVDDKDRLVGILSLNDAVLTAGTGRHVVRSAAVLDTLRAICAHPLPAPSSAASLPHTSALSDPVIPSTAIGPNERGVDQRM
jgi:CBS domain-containing protein